MLADAIAIVAETLMSRYSDIDRYSTNLRTMTQADLYQQCDLLATKLTAVPEVLNVLER